MRAFLRLSRLKFLVGGVLGVGFGTAVAAFEGIGVDWRFYAIAQLAITSLQLMTHYSNDYFDRECDALAQRTPFSGGSGALLDGALAPQSALAAAIACGIIGLSCAVVLLMSARAVAAVLVVLIAALSWTYSAPPMRLLSRGLGEFDTALIVGVLVPLSGYAVQTGTLDRLVIASSLPVAAAMFVMMIAVEIPDVAADRAAGKRNLVVRAGRDRVSRLLLAGLCCAAGALGIAAIVGAPLTVVPLVAVAVPACWRLYAVALHPTPASVHAASDLAARGVTVFLLVSLGSLLGYLAAEP